MLANGEVEKLAVSLWCAVVVAELARVWRAADSSKFWRIRLQEIVDGVRPWARAAGSQDHRRGGRGSSR